MFANVEPLVSVRAPFVKTPPPEEAELPLIVEAATVPEAFSFAIPPPPTSAVFPLIRDFCTVRTPIASFSIPPPLPR